MKNKIDYVEAMTRAANLIEEAKAVIVLTDHGVMMLGDESNLVQMVAQAFVVSEDVRDIFSKANELIAWMASKYVEEKAK